jgi:hypothetical protein
VLAKFFPLERVKGETHASLQVWLGPKVCCQINMLSPLVSHTIAVHCVDASEIGVSKTLKLASERGVRVHARQGRDRIFSPKFAVRLPFSRLCGGFGFSSQFN